MYQTLWGGGKKPKKLKMQRQSEDNIIKNIRHLLRQSKLKKMKHSKTE